jgi:Txe/YoeB family toxin of toxin-antitoxin system
MIFEVRFTKEAAKEIKKLTSKQCKKLKDILLYQISEDPFVGKKLVGDLAGLYSMRLNLQDRIVYTIDKANKTIYIHQVKRHYEN